ncbi:MAG: hypothetical protein R2874_15940 [Desulfobacterales bacterium]
MRIPKILAIDSEEVRLAISEQIEAIVETVRIAPGTIPCRNWPPIS